MFQKSKREAAQATQAAQVIQAAQATRREPPTQSGSPNGAPGSRGVTEQISPNAQAFRRSTYTCSVHSIVNTARRFHCEMLQLVTSTTLLQVKHQPLWFGSS